MFKNCYAKKRIGKSFPLVLMWVFLVSIVGFSLVPDKKDVNLSTKPYIANKRAENYFNGKTPAGKVWSEPYGPWHDQKL